MALPNSVFIRSAWASGVDRPRAMSLVTWPPPTGTEVGEDQIAVEEDADRGRAAAHVDDGDAELDLVLDQAGEPGGIGADDERLDLEMAAADRGAVVAHAGGRAR